MEAINLLASVIAQPINCPCCGGDNTLRQWDHVWVVRDEVSMQSDGTIVSYSAETDDVTETFYACENCGNKWNDAGELRRSINKAKEARSE